MSLASGLHQFLPRMSSNAVTTTDNPVKHQIQAWNQINHSQMDQIHSQMAMARPTQMPEDVTALVERENYGKDSAMSQKDTNGKNAVTKTYHTIKDIISAKFKKDQVTAGSLDELNNATSFQQQIVQQQRISPYAIKKPRPDEAPYNGQTRPNTDSPIYLQSNTMNAQQYINSQIQAQRAASQPQLNFSYDPTYLQQQNANQTMPIPNERRGSIDNVEVTDSDDGGFINKGHRRSNRTPIMHETPYLTPNTQNYYEKQKTPQFTGYRPQSMIEHINEKRLVNQPESHMTNGNESGRESRNNMIENSRKQATPINNTSDYEKGEQFSSNVDSGRESLAYTPGSRNQNSGQHNSDQNVDGNDSEWVDVIDAELKHILEPGMQEMTLNKEPSGRNSISSASPSLPNIMGPPPRPHKSHVRKIF